MTAVVSTILDVSAAIAACIMVTWQIPTADLEISGLAMFADPGVFEQVAVNRGRIAEVGQYDAWLESAGLAGTVALIRNADRGRRVWITNPITGAWEGPFLSIDCANRHHYRRRWARNSLLDVDAATAARWHMRGPVPVRIRFVAPADVGLATEKPQTVNPSTLGRPGG